MQQPSECHNEPILKQIVIEQQRGGTVLLEADEDELIYWALAYVRQQLEQGIPNADAADEEE